jgi:hypothetical protein
VTRTRTKTSIMKNPSSKEDGEGEEEDDEDEEEASGWRKKRTKVGPCIFDGINTNSFHSASAQASNQQIP